MAHIFAYLDAMADPMFPSYEVQAEDGIPVELPSGAIAYVLTDKEESYLQDRIARYLSDNHFVNISDTQDIDRMVVFELLIYRWTLWMSRGRDYFNEDIKEKELAERTREYCVDEATEILTASGWMHVDEIAVGDLALTLAPHGSAEWQAIEVVHRFADAQVYEIRNRDHWSVSTAGHRWPVRRVDQRLADGRRGIGPLKWTTTEALDNRDSLVLSAVGGASTSAKWSDAFVEVVVWYWTEGTSRGGATRIYQSWQVNADYCDQIEAALRLEFGHPGALPLKPDLHPEGPYWYRVDRSNGIAEFRLGRPVRRLLHSVFADPHRMVVSPGFLTELTQAQLMLFIEVSVKADGWEIPYKAESGERSYARVSQADPDRSRALEMACVLAGKPVRTVYDASIDMWRTVLLAERACVPLRKQSVGERTPLDRRKVWCPQTANQTWLARRNGFIYFTGNSTEVRQLKKSLGLDKATRDRTRGDDSIAAFWDNLQRRAREFGYKRNEEAVQAITSMQRIKAMLQFHRNCDLTERKENHCEIEDVLEVIDEEVHLYDQIDEKFRFDVQTYWVRQQ